MPVTCSLQARSKHAHYTHYDVQVNNVTAPLKKRACTGPLTFTCAGGSTPVGQEIWSEVLSLSYPRD